LSLLGYGVTIYEALPVLGGMLSVGIPAYRLPRDILNMEIEGIRKLGVDMKTNRFFSLGGDRASFRNLGFHAVFLSTGAHHSIKIGIPGERFRGVYPGVEFLRDMNLGKKIEMGKKVAVIGGGNVAVDVARSALRLGARKVEIYYRRSRNEMPAIPEEVEEAVQEGVKIHFLTSPLRMIGKGEKVAEMECARMKLGEPDGSGRRRPVPIKGSNFKVQADTVIAAIGQRVDRKALRGLDTNQNGTVRINPGTGGTSLKGVFAGGDLVRGPGWAIDAIADGKKGAQSINEYLS
jgi:NADPH-dependent glutamate synthase beta subunit-like oxidoreductase